MSETFSIFYIGNEILYSVDYGLLELFVIDYIIVYIQHQNVVFLIIDEPFIMSIIQHLTI